MKLQIGNLTFGEMPLIAGVLTDADIPHISEDIHEDIHNVDLIELRVDMFNDITPAHVKEVFKTAKEIFKKPIIATARDIREGGQREVPHRTGIYELISSFSDIVDVELNSTDIKEAKRLCAKHKKILIASYHNFELTPDDAFLDSVVSRGKEMGADIIKIAGMANSRDDFIRLLLFTLRHKEEGLITMSMGDNGLPSRVFNPLFGSLITYSYINKPSAPGQLSAKELMDIFRRLKIR
ncbi:MAG: type I 3-dehydroquinate dehydratase [Thermodesulfovibrionales bacterium]|nr:type I 3-dehydroquinate dehydratase [Thermodesulfovibrionales bacterium]